MRRKNRPGIPQANINLTSLLDITFVLLISFMVVAPALRYNVDLELPKVGRSTQAKEKKTVSIQVTYSGTTGPEYFVNGKSTPLSELPAAVKAHEDFKTEPVVALESDKSVPWEHVARLINELKMNDINSLGIVTERGK